MGIKDQIATFYDTFSYLNKEWQLNDTDILRGYCKIPIFSKTKNEIYLIICHEAGEVGVPNI